MSWTESSHLLVISILDRVSFKRVIRDTLEIIHERLSEVMPSGSVGKIWIINSHKPVVALADNPGTPAQSSPPFPRFAWLSQQGSSSLDVSNTARRTVRHL